VWSAADAPQRPFSRAAGGSRPAISALGWLQTGSFQEALDLAIAAAQAADAETGADIITEWQLGTVSGRAGGFPGFRELTVEIETV
jgi:hypothetical protein